MIITASLFITCTQSSSDLEIQFFETKADVKVFEESKGAKALPPLNFLVSNPMGDSVEILQFFKTENSGLIHYSYYEVTPEINIINMSWSNNLGRQMLVPPRNGLDPSLDIKSTVDPKVYPEKTGTIYASLNHQFKDSKFHFSDDKMHLPTGQRSFMASWQDEDKYGFGRYQIIIQFLETDSSSGLMLRAELLPS